MAKKTKQPCFSNGTEFMVWQDRNCCDCAKAVFYNEKTGHLPAYRCAVQRDMEKQASGLDEIMQRSWEACQGRECPYKKSKTAKTPVLDVPNFAAGVSLVGGDKTPPRAQNAAKTGENAPDASPETAKPEQNEPKMAAKPSEPVQTECKRNANAKQTDIWPKITPEERKKAERRAFEKTWREKIEPNIAQELTRTQLANMKEQEWVESQRLLETFTMEENMRIAFAPLVLNHIAWVYTKRVVDEAAARRITETKKLTRAVREIRGRYVDSLRKDLDAAHMARIERQTEAIMDECGGDFTILWFSINQALKTRYPGDPYQELRTNAYCALMAIKVLREHMAEMNALIREKIPNSIDAPILPEMVALETLLDAYMSDYIVDQTQHVKGCHVIFKKNIARIEWGVED